MKFRTFHTVLTPLRDRARMAAFLLSLFPRLPSRPVNWVTRTPVVEKVTYPALQGEATGDLYRPSGEGRHRGIVVFLGVVPFGSDHPQIPRLGTALARAGFAALLFWSPAMRDFRLDPADIENVALAYEWLLKQPYVDPDRSGLMGTCVGGSFALMAAAHPRIRNRVSFVGAYAPYSSMFTLLQDAASSSTIRVEKREFWPVDQLTRKVIVYSLTQDLPTEEAVLLRQAVTGTEHPVDIKALSENGRRVSAFFTHPEADQAGRVIDQLPITLLERSKAISPIFYVNDIQAPLIVLLHDQGDSVIPVGESRRLRALLSTHPGVHYQELQFQHLNPAHLPFWRLIIELIKFYKALYPLFESHPHIPKAKTTSRLTRPQDCAPAEIHKK
jgi:acetyl esterase/lipase